MNTLDTPITVNVPTLKQTLDQLEQNKIKKVERGPMEVKILPPIEPKSSVNLQGQTVGRTINIKV